MKQDHTLLRIRPIRPEDIPDVSRIHAAVLPTVTARVGIPFLSQFYRTLSTHTWLQNAIVATIGSRVVGCITVTKDSEKTSKLLSSTMRLPSMYLYLFRAILYGSVTVGDLWDRLMTERELLRSGPQPYPTILTCVVDAGYQGKGIGTRLLAAAETSFREGDTLFVDTETSNTSAQKFYMHHGFIERYRVRSSIVYAKHLIGKTRSDSQ